MGLTLGTTSDSINRILSRTSQQLSLSYQRLASGERITRAADDSAGLAIAENQRGQIRSMAQAERNANDAISFVQVAEGGLTEVNNIIIRLRELAIEGASDTVGDTQRSLINQEAQNLIQEVDRLANSTQYNNVYLLNGKAPKSVLEFQVGTYNNEDNRIGMDTSVLDVRSSALGIDGLNYESLDNSRDALEKVDSGMNKLLSARSTLGAMQNRLQSAVRSLQVNQENLAEAHSRIVDTDIAAETSNLVRTNILQSVGISVLAQANSFPAILLKLLA